MPNGWEWAILVLIAVLLIGGARLSGISRDVFGDAPELEETPVEETQPTSPSSPTAPVPAAPGAATPSEASVPVVEPSTPPETD